MKQKRHDKNKAVSMLSPSKGVGGKAFRNLTIPFNESFAYYLK